MIKDKHELFVKMALDAWNIQIDRTTKLFNALTDNQLKQEVAPGRNSGIYLLGHLTAVHDALFPLLDLGEKLYPELDEYSSRIQTNPRWKNLRQNNCEIIGMT